MKQSVWHVLLIRCRTECNKAGDDTKHMPECWSFYYCTSACNGCRVRYCCFSVGPLSVCPMPVLC